MWRNPVTVATGAVIAPPMCDSTSNVPAMLGASLWMSPPTVVYVVCMYAGEATIAPPTERAPLVLVSSGAST